MSLQGKHALVTGGSRGIGRGIALKLAESGARVGIHYYVNEAAAKDTLDRVRKNGGDGFIVQADISRIDDVRRMFADVKQRFGTLDVLSRMPAPRRRSSIRNPWS
jgi:NAD(P)-dependent dehydrogenase (short-subunit alcohol dehydrogenase family)